MDEQLDLGPLIAVRHGDCATVTFSGASALDLEIPDNYEADLRDQLDELMAAGVRFELDLQNLPGVSSRQLGLLIILHKVVRDAQPRLPLRGVTPAVRHVLEVTRTSQFFEA